MDIGISNEDLLQIRGELLPGESLIWAGVPARDWFYNPERLFWTSLGWGLLAFSALVLWGTLFLNGMGPLRAVVVNGVLPVGFYLGVVWLLLDVRRRRCTCYGLTNRRVLILSTLWGRHLRSVALRNVPAFRLILLDGDRGTIQLGPVRFWDPLLGGWPGNYHYTLPAMEGISGAAMLYSWIERGRSGETGIVPT